MTLHDPFARPGYGRIWRVRWFKASRGLGPTVRDRPPPGARVRGRYRRKLASIERRLAADEPLLSSRFVMFNQLTAGEPPTGAERLSRPAWPRPRPVRAPLCPAYANNRR